MRLNLREKLARTQGVVLVSLLACAAGVFGQSGQGNPSAPAAREKEECTANLKKIFAAIEAYQTDHRDLPNWLSDLVPQYLPDANTLVCPVSRRTGQTEGAPLADPKISSSYLFEFCPLPLGKRDAPEAPDRTRRDWKRRQMGLLGSKVPIVRCRLHNPALNLAFDGTIYESPGMWEMNFTNRVRADQLTARALFANEGGRAPEAPTKGKARTFPPRDPQTPKQLLDLSGVYNAMLGESWHGGTNNQLAGLEPGVQALAGVDFDIRGLVQLAGKAGATTNFPTEAKNIRVRQKCARVHFLHAAAWGKPADEGKQIGAYVIHYATNNMRLEVPIIYGEAVRDWHEWSGEKPGPKELTVAWKGENGVSKRANAKIRLFRTTWNNLLPDVEIESIDFVSSSSQPGPFLVAITVE